MFKLFIKRHEFKVKMGRVLFTPTVNMYNKFIIKIDDAKIVKVLRARIRITKSVVARLHGLFKTNGKIKFNVIYIKTRLHDLSKLNNKVLCSVFKIEAMSKLSIKINNLFNGKTNVINKVNLENRTTLNILSEVKIKAHAWLVRLRKLEDIEDMTLEEIGDMTLEEISYIKL